MTTPKTSLRDTIVEEIHRTRRRIAEQFGGDIGAIVEDARKRQDASGRAIWQPPDQRAKGPSAKR